MILVLVFRPQPKALLYWLHGLFMLVMFPFGFHFVPHGGLTRTFTGALFSFGLVYYLSLNPLTSWLAWKSARALRFLAYLALIAACIASLLWSMRSGGAIAAVTLTGLGVIGLAGLLLLTAANLFVLPATLRALRAHPAPSPQ
jgi:hypothetical protein